MNLMVRSGWSLLKEESRDCASKGVLRKGVAAGLITRTTLLDYGLARSALSGEFPLPHPTSDWARIDPVPASRPLRTVCRSEPVHSRGQVRHPGKHPQQLLRDRRRFPGSLRAGRCDCQASGRPRDPAKSLMRSGAAVASAAGRGHDACWRRRYWSGRPGAAS